MKRKDLDNRIFPSGLPYNEWVQFEAEGFTAPVCGVIYRGEVPPSNGMPLGGIDTGCLDLEANGTFGYCTIFNSHVPRRGPLNLPFLGLRVNGTTMLLARDVWPKGSKTIGVMGINRGRRITGSNQNGAKMHPKRFISGVDVAAEISLLLREHLFELRQV